MKANLILDISTDKSHYTPGDVVTFSVEGAIPANALVRYRHAGTVVAEQSLASDSWTWTAPTGDYRGYLVDIYTKDSETVETVYGTVGVDVSSDWSRFPRYGFVADYDDTRSAGVIAQDAAFLNRCHINGVQYYDWQYKHHWPLGGTRGSLLTSYTDIANRSVVTQVVKNLIAEHHKYGMKTMFYNLCFGALDDGAADGVKNQWRLYKDRNHANNDSHPLPDSWKSDIYLLDPSNAEWQSYLADRNDDVYASFDFDGFHIDQLGSRGSVYDYNGGNVNLPQGFASLINAMKARHPGKSLVMNAVSNYASKNIVQTGNVDFMYSEMWAGESQFSDLLTTLKANQTYSSGKLNQVFAAYMN